MVMRKKTLRRLSPVARKVARLAGEADSVGRRLKNIVREIESLELDSTALKHAKDQLVHIGHLEKGEIVWDPKAVRLEGPNE
jgi:iron-sulfur cluster repair protein YtfE (RIC family)